MSYFSTHLTSYIVMGKLESSPDVYQFSEHYLPWHAHITAVTVAPEARRLGIGKLLTQHLEAAADANNAYFVDLFVRVTNDKAITFYKSMGYSVFRTVKEYYGDHSTDPTLDAEDAYDMRKPMKRDVKLEHIRENGEKFEVDPQDVW
jgi:N-terminal acetyltransferase B complex catalytic subunit